MLDLIESALHRGWDPTRYLLRVRSGQDGQRGRDRWLVESISGQLRNLEGVMDLGRQVREMRRRVSPVLEKNLAAVTGTRIHPVDLRSDGRWQDPFRPGRRKLCLEVL